MCALIAEHRRHAEETAALRFVEVAVLEALSCGVPADVILSAAKLRIQSGFPIAHATVWDDEAHDRRVDLEDRLATMLGSPGGKARRIADLRPEDGA
jgi:hypothetical protein